jgi:energy-coupling factor transporter ATP-binding protein EcfA2
MITSFKTEQLGIGFDFDINLEADKQFYCFIGKNGVGKTQLLENMAKALIFSHSMFSIKEGKLRLEGMFKDMGERLQKHRIQLPKNLIINGKQINFTRWGDRDFIDFGSIFELHRTLVIERDLRKNDMTFVFCDKPIVFVGEKNRGFARNIDSKNIKLLPDRENRFADSFERTLKYLNGGGLEQQEVADWFFSRLMINPELVEKNLNKEHEAITVLRLMERLAPVSGLITENEDGTSKHHFTYGEGKLLINGIPFDKLSTGYVSIIKIFQEIVAGYSGWTDEAKLNEVDGIVFIDELEPHLHISWQTKIIRLLREFFPNTKFYISTHSPLVLAGLKSGEAYELEQTGDVVNAKAIHGIENYFLNDIVKQFFGVDLNLEKNLQIDKERQQKTKELLQDLLNTVREENA